MRVVQAFVVLVSFPKLKNTNQIIAFLRFFKIIKKSKH